MSALKLIEQLEALARQATPGPWTFDQADRSGGSDFDAVLSASGYVMDNLPHPKPVTAENQALCAALVTALPALAEFVRAHSWRTVDTLPEIAVPVFVRLQSASGAIWSDVARRRKRDWLGTGGAVYHSSYVSHWMPTSEVTL